MAPEGPEAELARQRLWRDSERALPLLTAGLTSDNPAQIAAIFDMLRARNEPAAMLAAVTGVLERPDSTAWPAALSELAQLRQPGAGERLLALAISAKSPEQRSAALAALARSDEPPPGALRALLPLLTQDGPELPLALAAAARAAARHRQHDLATARVLRDGALSAEDRQLLATLPGRLASLSKPSADPGRSNSSAVPAAMLAVALGLERAPVLKGVRVLGCCGDEANGPATAILDGVWDNPDAHSKTAWFDNGVIQNPWIVLDLGESRTVAGLRIWNLNRLGLTDRGWREVDVFINDHLEDDAPAASGFLPKASDKKNAGDYSDTIPVPFVRGRYVKLQARSLWTDQKLSGLAEVQVLGW